MVQGSEGPIVPLGPAVLDFSKQPRWANGDDSSDETFVSSGPIGLALPSYFILPPSVQGHFSSFCVGTLFGD